MIITSFDCYRMFLGLNSHFFQPSYDYFKYGGVPVKFETFNRKRQDEQFRYTRLAKKFHTSEELENFIVANLLEARKRLWIGALSGQEPDEVYTRWQGRTQSLQYTLVSQIKNLVDTHQGFNTLFKSEAGQHPEILKSYMRQDLSIESFVLLDTCINFIPRLDRVLAEDRNWLLARNKAVKYRPFLERLNTDAIALRRAIHQAVQDLGVTN